MFIVFNKQKIYSYVVALTTVMVLFCGAAFLENKRIDTVQTFSGTEKKLPIYSVETNENNIALTINCAWS